MAQVRVLNAALSIASPYTIANNDLLGIVEPRDASRVSMLGFFHAIHQVMRSMMITGFAIFSVHAGGYEPSRRRKPPNPLHTVSWTTRNTWKRGLMGLRGTEEPLG